MEYDPIDVYKMLSRLNAMGYKAVIRYAEMLAHADEYRAKTPGDSYTQRRKSFLPVRHTVKAMRLWGGKLYRFRV